MARLSPIRLAAWSGLVALSVLGWATFAFAQLSSSAPHELFPRPSSAYGYFKVECFSGAFTTAGQGEVFSGVSGASAAITGLTSGNAASMGGLCEVRLGTDTTGRAGIQTAANALNAANGTAKFFIYFTEGTASDATNTYTTRFGFGDSLSTEPTDGCYWRYTHGTNSGKYQGVARAGGAETTVDTGITYSGSAVRAFGVTMSPTTCTFWNNGVSVGAISDTNVPNGGEAELTGVIINSIKSAGTTDRRALYVDEFEVEWRSTTPRAFVPF